MVCWMLTTIISGTDWQGAHMQQDDNSLQAKREHERSYSGTSKSSLSPNMVKWATDAPFLKREEEHDLALKWHENQDMEALHKIASAHARLVMALAVRFRRFNLPLADLVQEGYIGLLEAAARFNPAREVRFSTYATWWIRASIQDYILKNWSIVRGGTSSAQKALFFNLRRLRIQIAQEDNSLTQEEIYHRIAKQLGVGLADVETMDRRLSSPDNSLNAPLSQDGDNSLTQMDMLIDEAPLQDERIEHEIDGERQAKWLTQALTVLNRRRIRRNKRTSPSN